MSEGRPKARGQTKPGIHYFVVATLRDGKRLVTGTPQEVANEQAARNRIELMPRNAIGLAAYEVELDIEGEQVSEPALIARAGLVPGVEVNVAEDA